MKSTASAALASAEKTAASANAPNTGVSSLAIVANAKSLLMSGCMTRAAMPIAVGNAANASSASPLSAMPVVTARSSRAPNAFWISPGDTTNAGPRKKSSRQPDCGEPPANRSIRAGSMVTASQTAGKRDRQRRDHREPDDLDGELYRG